MLYHPGGFRLPALMWKRSADRLGSGYERQPAPSATTADTIALRARTKGTETVALLITMASLVVAIASFVRDLIAG
jgi:hypothetical protein